MRRLGEHFQSLLDDEYGGDAIEYALVAGLIVLVFLAAFIQVADGVGTTFNDVEAGVMSA